MYNGILCSVLYDFATPWTVACQASLSVEFPGKNTGVGVSSPTPGDLPDPGIGCPAFQVTFYHYE